MITIYDIAKELKISPSTVSRTFSNPGLVNEKTRRRVLKKAEEMGYQVNMVASQLRNKSSNIIALVSLQGYWSWFTDDVANGVQDEAREAGYEIVVLNGSKEHQESIAICEKMRFAGIIVAATELGRDTVYLNDVIPSVYVNRIIENQYRILPDDNHGISQAMDYLRDMGHSRIGYLNGPDSSMHSRIRYETFARKMREFRFPLRQEWIKKGDWLVEGAYCRMMEILSCPEYPTALLVANDQMCIGVYRAILEKGLQPGREISVIGYDNADYTKWMIPSLTTISLPLYEMGKQACKKLLAQIKGLPQEKEMIVRGELLKRNSVAKL